MILDRLTIDIDAYEANMEIKAIQAYYGLSNLDIVEKIVVHVSTSGRGVHLEGHLSEMLSEDERYALRRSLHDDTKRTDLDEERGEAGHATDIFWSEKDGNEGERERVPDVWAALDRIEGNRSDYNRVKSLAQHGRKGVWATHGLNRPSMADDLS
jgi:hypothetical protein